MKRDSKYSYSAHDTFNLSDAQHDTLPVNDSTSELLDQTRWIQKTRAVSERTDPSAPSAPPASPSSQLTLIDIEGRPRTFIMSKANAFLGSGIDGRAKRVVEASVPYAVKIRAIPTHCSTMTFRKYEHEVAVLKATGRLVAYGIRASKTKKIDAPAKFYIVQEFISGAFLHTLPSTLPCGDKALVALSDFTVGTYTQFNCPPPKCYFSSYFFTNLLLTATAAFQKFINLKIIPMDMHPRNILIQSSGHVEYVDFTHYRPYGMMQEEFLAMRWHGVATLTTLTNIRQYLAGLVTANLLSSETSKALHNSLNYFITTVHPMINEDFIAELTTHSKLIEETLTPLRAHFASLWNPSLETLESYQFNPAEIERLSQEIPAEMRRLAAP